MAGRHGISSRTRACGVTPASARRAGAAVALAALGFIGCARSPEDAVVAAVKRLGGRADSIRRLDLAHTTAGDADLARLAKAGGPALAGVEELDLTHTRIGDAGLASLVLFPSLTKLSLTLTDVTDAGLPALAAVPQLSDLYLIETAITDAAVEPLSTLKHLRTLVLLRTRLSQAALARLRNALPGTAIHVEPPGARTRNASR